MTDRPYEAMIWTSDPTTPGRRVTIEAHSLDEARGKLEDAHGAGTVFNLHNAEDAERPR